LPHTGALEAAEEAGTEEAGSEEAGTEEAGSEEAGTEDEATDEAGTDEEEVEGLIKDETADELAEGPPHTRAAQPLTLQHCSSLVQESPSVKHEAADADEAPYPICARRRSWSESGEPEDPSGEHPARTV
jgi:hypothetical protein